jgi:transposase
LQGFEKPRIAEVMGLATSTVEYRARACRDRGIQALMGERRSARPRKIDGEQARLLNERIDAGPTADDGAARSEPRRSSESPGMSRA